MKGFLVVGHGTRSPIGTAQFLWLAARLRERLDPFSVEPAFLELAEPTIDAAVERLVVRGIHGLITVPLLLFAAGHAKDDVPEAVRTALKCRGKEDIEQAQAAHLGCHPLLLALSQQRLEKALCEAGKDRQQSSHANTFHLLVGRGSRDESATAEMHEFARLSSGGTGLPTEVAFLAMAKPPLAEKLDALCERGCERIIVQPHLLFHGDLVETLGRQVAEAKAKYPHVDLLTVGTLADPPGTAGRATELLEQVILDRCQSGGIL